MARLAHSAFIKAFGDRVRKLRVQRGYSQEELAHRARLHRTQISLVERGQRSVRLDTIMQLAVALGVQPAVLMPKL